MAGTPSSPTASRTGKSTTDTALARSEATDTARRPTRSTSTPTTGAMTMPGSAVRAPASPAVDAEPVRSRISQGTTTMTSAFDTPPTTFAHCSSTSGRRDMPVMLAPRAARQRGTSSAQVRCATSSSPSWATTSIATSRVPGPTSTLIEPCTLTSTPGQVRR